MVEKYRGAVPPGSIWFRLDRDESIALMRHQGILGDMTSEQIATVDSADIQAAKGEVTELEQMLKDAGLKIVTLYD